MDDTDASAALRQELEETKRALADAHAEIDLARAELETEKDLATRARILSDAGFEAVCLHIDGRFVDLNRAAVELLGAPPEKLLGKPILSLAPPEYHAEIVERVRSGESSWYEVVALRPDGTRFPAELRGRTVQLDGRSIRATAVRDLSEKKRAEEALRNSEVRFRGVFEGAIDGIVLIDRNNHIVDANPAACRLLRRDTLTGIKVGDLVVREPDEKRERTDSVAVPPSSTGPVIERRLRRGDGTTVEVEVAAGRISEETTEWVLRDLTRRRELEAERQVLRAELARAQRLEALGRLAGGVAHDFNNLLTVIGLGLEALAKNRANELEAALLVEVRGATERAVDLTRRLLALGRRQVLRPRRVDLSTTVDDMAWLLLRMVGDQVEVRLDLAPSAGAVEVDPDQLFQVLMNLSINARDAMPEGGLLTIATRTAPASGYVSIVVTDTGVGMDAETVSRAFEPFFTTKPDAVGSGLGLAIVHGIVVQSHGEISIESEPGLGTRIEVLLPSVAEADERIPSKPPARRGGATIAIIEDDASVRGALERVLEKAGYRAVAFAEPMAALADTTWITEVDAVVTDVIMPSMRGPELVARLRTLRPELRALFVSGYTGEDPSVVPGSFLQKPFSSEDFLEAVDALLAS